MLTCQLKDTPGVGKFLRSEYRIYNLSTRSVINQLDWKRKAFPGALLDMSAIMVIYRAQGGSCPRPHYQGTVIRTGFNELRGGSYVWYVFTK